jgi:hypothetical protein
MKNIFLAPIAVLLTFSVSVEAAQRAGIIDLMRGNVLILDGKGQKVLADPEGKRGRKTEKGAVFFEGETIQTKDGARVKLKFDEGGKEGGNEVVLGANTTLLVDRAGTAGKPGTSLNLKSGQARSQVNRKYSGEGADVFEVRTPNAVAGVRGTNFFVGVDRAGNSTVAVQHGSVVLERNMAAFSGGGRRTASEQVRLAPGQFSEVREFAPPTAARPLSENKALSKDMSALGASKDAEGSEDSSSGAGSGADAGQPAASEKKAENKVENKDEAVVPVAMGREEAKDAAPVAEGRAPASKGSGPAPAMGLMGAANNSTGSAAGSRTPYDSAMASFEAMKKQTEALVRQENALNNGSARIPVTFK